MTMAAQQSSNLAPILRLEKIPFERERIALCISERLGFPLQIYHLRTLERMQVPAQGMASLSRELATKPLELNLAKL